MALLITFIRLAMQMVWPPCPRTRWQFMLLAQLQQPKQIIKSYFQLKEAQIEANKN
jgi:hypothetical protein